MNETNTKPFNIPKELVVEAYELVKSNKGSSGVDRESLEDFDKNMKDNLYKIWNRMSSGSYFPPAVKAVSIPKKSGGTRILGVPSVSDRIAQTVVKLVLEPMIDSFFHPDSYGYRPNKSALDAVGVTRQRCWQYNWVLEFDIKGLFDNIDHDLLMKAVRKHTDNKWIILYIERWLKASMQLEDGAIVQRDKGTPQGGVISPILSNLFLHYTFDMWMQRKHPTSKWARYADDGLVHCRTEREAQELLKELKERFAECKLELHPDKTKIVYCKNGNRKPEYINTKFTFLGYEFRRREAYNRKEKKSFVNFSPAISDEAGKSMREKIRKTGIKRRTEWTIEHIAELFNPIIRGWIEYYGCYNPWKVRKVLEHFDQTLVRWAMRKYKKLRGHKTRAWAFLERIKTDKPGLFAHWKKFEPSRGCMI